MTLSLDQTWLDPQTSWNAKLERAREHLHALRMQVNEYRASEPYAVKPESTDVPERLAYRLHIWRPQPIMISTTVGDILHNLRASLESVAFELARRSHGGMLTPAQEGKSTFPIKKIPADFEDFFRQRKDLYSDHARSSFHAFQPFVELERAHAHGVATGKEIGSDSEWHLLYRLDKLWNIDKRRRLIPGVWWPEMFWWGSNGESKRRMSRGDGTSEHGSILFYIEGADAGMGDIVMHEFNLVLRDDPAFALAKDVTQDVVELMEQFTNHVDSIIRQIAWGITSTSGNDGTRV
ncbi:hypothetical protein AB0K15_13205 [Amycolatopsis sp. NPDC049253]|uniref:hypothetical protein n=1 Tax=Amycolatopsis sp. NPDC049253 TaxID=3155274 RepID=UPI0034210CEA